MKLTQALKVEAEQGFVIDRFRDADALGVANLFLSVYGQGYPFQQYYDPEWLMAANASGDVVSIVARTPKGDIVSHMAAYRSAAVNPRLYEGGIGLTLPDYRALQASSKIMQYLREIFPTLALDGMYGEAVCNHIGMQKICYVNNLVDTALEIDLMPAEAYVTEKSAEGRVSCLFNVFSLKPMSQTLHIPARYMDATRFIIDALPAGRTLKLASLAPTVERSQIETRIFDFAAVSRCQIIACGQDVAGALADMERQADEEKCTTRQAFLNLADPGIGLAADLLREHGYFLAGITPRWFGGDGLLLQKLIHPPGFGHVKLCHDRARQLLSLVEEDWRTLNGAG